MPDNPPSKPVIHYDQLSSTAVMSALGLIAAQALHHRKQITLMVSTGGIIEIVPVGELELDLLDESSALQELLKRDYTDQQMADYLRQREIRLSNNPLEGPEAPVHAPTEPKSPLLGAQSLAKVDHR